MPDSVIEEVRHAVRRPACQIQSVPDFALHIRRQSPAFHRSRDHLVSHLNGRRGNDVVRFQGECIHQGDNGLLTKVAIQAVIHLVVNLSEVVASLGVANRLSLLPEIPPTLRRVTLPDSANDSRLALPIMQQRSPHRLIATIVN